MRRGFRHGAATPVALPTVPTVPTVPGMPTVPTVPTVHTASRWYLSATIATLHTAVDRCADPNGPGNPAVAATEMAGWGSEMVGRSGAPCGGG